MDIMGSKIEELDEDSVSDVTNTSTLKTEETTNSVITPLESERPTSDDGMQTNICDKYCESLSEVSSPRSQLMRKISCLQSELYQICDEWGKPRQEEPNQNQTKPNSLILQNDMNKLNLNLLEIKLQLRKSNTSNDQGNESELIDSLEFTSTDDLSSRLSKSLSSIGSHFVDLDELIHDYENLKIIKASQKKYLACAAEITQMKIDVAMQELTLSTWQKELDNQIKKMKSLLE